LQTLELGVRLFQQFKFQSSQFNCYTPAEDESNDITNTGQLIFIHVLCVQQKLASLYNLNGITTAKICSWKERKCLLLGSWPEKKTDIYDNR